MINLSAGERRDLLVALSIAIEQENKAIFRLQQDGEFRKLAEAIGNRQEQIQRFNKLAEKLRKQSN
jgi:hypothetical protein